MPSFAIVFVAKPTLVNGALSIPQAKKQKPPFGQLLSGLQIRLAEVDFLIHFGGIVHRLHHLGGDDKLVDVRFLRNG